MEVTSQPRRLAEEAQPAVLLQRARQHPGLAQHLEAVAEASSTRDAFRAAAALTSVITGDLRRHRPATQIVAVGEAAGQHDEVEPAGRLVSWCQTRSTLAPVERSTATLQKVTIAVGAGEDDDADARCHSERPRARGVLCSITGLASRRSASSVAVVRAAPSSAASTSKLKERPARTWATPAKPSAGSARSIVAPSGSAMPGRNCTSTRAWNLMASHRTSHPVHAR